MERLKPFPIKVFMGARQSLALNTQVVFKPSGIFCAKCFHRGSQKSRLIRPQDTTVKIDYNNKRIEIFVVLGRYIMICEKLCVLVDNRIMQPLTAGSRFHLARCNAIGIDHVSRMSDTMDR